MHAKFFLVVMKVQWGEWGRNIVLGNNTGNKVVGMWPIRYRCVGVWMSTGWPCMYAYSWPYVRVLRLIVLHQASVYFNLLLLLLWKQYYYSIFGIIIINFTISTACKKRLLTLLLFSWTGIPTHCWLKQTAGTCGRIE
jgi:hypothetical protein